MPLRAYLRSCRYAYAEWARVWGYANAEWARALGYANAAWARVREVGDLAGWPPLRARVRGTPLARRSCTRRAGRAPCFLPEWQPQSPLGRARMCCNSTPAHPLLLTHVAAQRPHQRTVASIHPSVHASMPPRYTSARSCIAFTVRLAPVACEPFTTDSYSTYLRASTRPRNHAAPPTTRKR